MRMRTLYDRYFGDAEEEEAKNASEQREKIGQQVEWITRPFYAEFKKWLDAQLIARQPGPGSHETMLYAVGVRDGVQIVRDHLTAIEKECIEHTRGAE